MSKELMNETEEKMHRERWRRMKQRELLVNWEKKIKR